MNRNIKWIALGVLVLAAPAAFAQPGTLIQNVPLPVPGFGVSVGVDCDGNVYYTNNPDADGVFRNNLYKMDKNGNLLATVPILDAISGASISIDEIAWDNTRNVFWGVEHGSNPEDVYQIDPNTGLATFQFTAAQTVSVGTFRDGLAYDGTDDTLWVSGDVSTTIEHYTSAGAFINQIVPTDAAGNPLGLISGVIVGVGDLLYLGRNGAVQIVQVRKSDGGFVNVFASPGGARDEGLECDPINFAPLLALWSREFNSPGFISVIELEPNTCACGGGEIVCVRTLGYWKNHASAWPVDNLTLGTVNYSQAQLLAILRQPVRGNGLVSLAHQLIAAKLNAANGAPVPAAVQAAIAAADALINGLVVPPVGAGYLHPSMTSGLSFILDQYNNGLAPDGPPHCEDGRASLVPTALPNVALFEPVQ